VGDGADLVDVLVVEFVFAQVVVVVAVDRHEHFQPLLLVLPAQVDAVQHFGHLRRNLPVGLGRLHLHVAVADDVGLQTVAQVDRTLREREELLALVVEQSHRSVQDLLLRFELVFVLERGVAFDEHEELLDGGLLVGVQRVVVEGQVEDAEAVGAFVRVAGCDQEVALVPAALHLAVRGVVLHLRIHRFAVFDKCIKSRLY